MKIIVKFLIVLLCVVIAAGVGGLITVYSLNRPTDRIQGEEIVFTVNKGDTLSQVGKRLQDENIIRSSLMFRLFGKIYGTGGMMKTGIYRIEEGSSALEVHNLLVAGSQMLFKVTIPEGWTAGMIAGMLEEHGITGREDFIEACKGKEMLERTGSKNGSVEGYLYPDTYYFSKDYPPEKIVGYMIDTFYEKLDDIYPDWQNLDEEEINERVILASIVEREYRDPSEAAMIASVFYNRLKAGMNLGSCATVVYALTEEQGKPHPERLTYTDLEVESEYNTYRRDGLPPGPISNPGYVALDAVFHPEKSDYLYFVLKDPESGSHHFSKSLGEHNQAYTLYIKGAP